MLGVTHPIVHSFRRQWSADAEQPRLVQRVIELLNRFTFTFESRRHEYL